MANRVLAVVRKMLNFAVDHDWIDANPAARIKKPAPRPHANACLTDDEIRRVWRLLEHSPPPPRSRPPDGRGAKGTKDDPICPVSAAHAAILKLRLLTAQRGGEVARMRWTDVDLDDRLVDDSDDPAKNKKAHRVPLTPRAPTSTAIKAQQDAAGDGRGRVQRRRERTRSREEGAHRDRALARPAGFPRPRSATNGGDSHGRGRYPPSAHRRTC